MVRAIAVIFNLLLVFYGFAQQSKYNFHQLTSAEGLSQSTNSFLYTDKCGYTWISALDGINVFDGKEVQVFKADPNDSFSMKGVNVQSPFFEDEKGNIWFTTSEAINCYQRNEGHFIHDFITDDINKGVYAASYLEQQRFLWVSYDESLYRYDIFDTGILKHTPVLDSFKAVRCAVTTDTAGRVNTFFGAFWNAQAGFEVIQFSPSYEVLSRDKWFDKPGNPLDSALTVYQVITEKENEAWFVTNAGLLHFDVKNPTSCHPIPPPVRSNIRTITSFSVDLFWVVLDNSEVYLFDKNNKEFLPNPVLFFNLDTKVPIEGVSNIFPIRDTIVWVSARKSGVYFSNIANKKFTSLFINNNLDKHSVDHVYQYSNDDVLVSSNEGKGWLFNRDKVLIEIKRLPPYFKQITGYDNIIWNISTKGICEYSKKEDKHIVKYSATQRDYLNDLVDVNHQYLLLATGKGLQFYNKQQDTLLSPIATGFTVKLFLDSRKRLWSAKASTELSIWDIEEGKEPMLHSVKNFKSLGTILHITEDKSRGVMWVGTSKGLVKIDIQTLEKEHITEANGLPNQYIHSIIIDQNDRLWLSTNKGVIQYIPEEVGEEQFKHFTSRDGLSADEYLHSAALYSSQGEIWFGSTKGVDVFNPSQMFSVGKAPRLSINSLQIYDKKWKGEYAIGAIDNIKLQHQDNTLTFQLSAMEYTDPLRNKFKVYLEYNGVVDSSFLSGNKVTYANLSPGEYIFSFTASNAEGIWQTTKKKLRIFIIPPYYQTWWFKSAMAFLILTFVSFASAFYYRYKLNIKKLELEKQKREADRQRAKLERNLSLQTERNRIASEMHDELGGGLSTIRNASAKAQKKKNPEDLYEILGRVSQISINLINNMRGIIWAMDTDYDSLTDLMAHIRHYTKEYSDDNDLLVQIDIPNDLPDLILNGQFRHNISLVVKEALHNIVKHANATKIEFKLIVEDELTIMIADNGKGFEPNKVERLGRGLRNMTKRMKTVGGTIKWQPVDKGGVQVILSAPISYNVQV